MKEQENEIYVLIHGAWNGGWVWGDVAEILRKRGNVVYMPTLDGLSTRMRSDTSSINLSTHINEVADLIEKDDLNNIVLVGWSYGGFVATGVTAKIHDRIKKVIYLDSIIPDNNTSLIDYIPDGNRVSIQEMAKNGDSVPAPAVSAWGLQEPTLAKLVEERMTPQPAKTFVEALRLNTRSDAVPKCFIYCTGYGKTMFTATYERVIQQGLIPCITLESNHFCMVSDPVNTAQAIVISTKA